MPSSRNDVTKKPQYVTAPTKNKYVAYSKMGKAHVIWASTLAEADKHAVAEGWTLPLGDSDGKTY